MPVVRDADRMSFAEIEKAIAALGHKARDGRLSIADLSGGTFTISNGGVYGSLLSTPILNPPQSGVLGMHKIERRPVAVGDQDRDPADDVCRALLRPPHRRRPRGGHVSRPRSRNASKTPPASCSIYEPAGNRIGARHHRQGYLAPARHFSKSAAKWRVTVDSGK